MECCGTMQEAVTIMFKGYYFNGWSSWMILIMSNGYGGQYECSRSSRTVGVATRSDELGCGIPPDKSVLVVVVVFLHLIQK
jgi:hypothetical protein